MTVTRFAPSPTGYLHIGGVRTALFSWLYARQHQGKFILRIEDTDRERSTQESVDAILNGMQWLGLDYDEGPYFPTERMARYQEVIQQLLDSGHAYKCYCSKQRLEKLRETQRDNKQKPRYDGTCRNLEQEDDTKEYVIRFKNPLTGSVVIDDLVRGKIIIDNSELDDLIIARSDGMPTYNLTVVVDDMDMQMSHIIRGDDHINNTPRQINILKALGAKLPQYAHVPMILGADGARLSKRHGAVSVLQYKEDGFLPQALLNYLVRLGWSYEDQEIFSTAQMIKSFELDKVNSAASTFNAEKLLWLNQQYIINSDPEYLAGVLVWHLDKFGLDVKDGPKPEAVVMAQKKRAKTMLEMASMSRYFYEDIKEYEGKAANKNLTRKSVEILGSLHESLDDLNTWQAEDIKKEIKNLMKKFAVGFGKVALPLRVAVTGTASSPSIDLTCELIGKIKVLDRIEQAIAWINAKQDKC